MSNNPNGAKEQTKGNWMPRFNLLLLSFAENMPGFWTTSTIRKITKEWERAALFWHKIRQQFGWLIQFKYMINYV
jgi:hypothetical protein